MYPVINSLTHFQPYDICRVKATGGLVIIQEVNLNTSQVVDEHQWSYSVIIIDTNIDNKCAWYYPNELEYVNNVFEMIAEASKHPFGSTAYKFRLPRR